MKRCMVRLGLSLMLAMGWWVQRLPAQAPAAPTPAAPTAPALAAPVYAPAQAPCACAADGMTGQPGQRSRLARIGLGCYTTHNSPGCGSLHSELTFIFGSCRQFFGEPCFARPVQYPAPEYGFYGH
jgi:hypothetical protein